VNARRLTESCVRAECAHVVKEKLEEPPMGYIHQAVAGLRWERCHLYIQYIGFEAGHNSRIYNFDVIDAKESRHFTVELPLEAFRPLHLGFQDGPEICFACLKKGLQEETGAPAGAHLNVGELDVRAYLETHRPAKARGKRI
jgi:hypothetical protein